MTRKRLRPIQLRLMSVVMDDERLNEVVYKFIHNPPISPEPREFYLTLRQLLLDEASRGP